MTSSNIQEYSSTARRLEAAGVAVAGVALACMVLLAIGCGRSGAPPETDMTGSAAASPAASPSAASAEPAGRAAAPGTSVELTAQGLFARTVEATGGEAALRNLQTSTATGTFSMPAMGMVGSLRIVQGAAGYARMEVEIPGAGKIERGVRGDTAWELSVMSGPRILDGAEATSALRQADPAWMLHIDTYYTETTYAGVDSVNGEATYCADLTTPEGHVETFCFSQESGRLLRLTGTQPTQMGDVESVSVFEDYRDIDGMLVPFRIRQSAMGVEQIIELTDVQLNVPLPEDAFELPSEVQALLQK